MEPSLPEVRANIRQALLDEFNNGLVDQWQTFLLPVLALICWTILMWFWMYATRIPAMQKAGIDPNSARHTGDPIWGDVPSSVRAKADNYNHLHEQPVLFYAIMFYAALTGGASQIALYAAWAYVGLRVLHSLVQSLTGSVPLRFGVFVLASFALFALVGTQVGAALHLLG